MIPVFKIVHFDSGIVRGAKLYETSDGVSRVDTHILDALDGWNEHVIARCGFVHVDRIVVRFIHNSPYSLRDVCPACLRAMVNT